MTSIDELRIGVDVLKHEVASLTTIVKGILAGQKTNNDVLGNPGREKTVRIHPYDEKKVIAELHPENHSDHIKALGRYELSSLIHLLFPDNIPAIYYVSNKRQFCLERIFADHDQPEITVKEETTFRMLMQEVGLNIDIARSNLVLRNGNLVYLDNSFVPWFEDGYPKYNKDLLAKAILEHIEESQQSQAMHHLNRLEELRHQAETTYKKRFKN